VTHYYLADLVVNSRSDQFGINPFELVSVGDDILD
jgi:hypothetical protein